MGITTELREDEYLRQARDGAYLEMLAQGKSVALYVRGISMYPCIKDYDFLTIGPFVEPDVRIGDIVMVAHDNAFPQSFFIHRVVRIKKTERALSFYTKGDNAGLALEGPFAARQIKGVVASVARKHIRINCHTRTYRACARIFAVFSLYAPAFLKIINLACNSLRERAFPYSFSRFFGKDPLTRNTQTLAVLVLRDLMHKESLKHASIAIIAEGIRWNYFCALAIDNRRTVVAEKNIGMLEKIVHIPPFVHRRLKDEAVKTVVEAARRHYQCAQIMKAFSEAHIDAIFLKGTFLSELLYRDTAARGVSNDIDILIREKDLRVSVSLLEGCGYAQAPEEEIEAWQWHKEMILTDAPPIDLHWDITMMKRTPERIDGFWQQAAPIRVTHESGEYRYYGLGDEALLAYVCVNIVHSKGYATLKYYFDISQLLSEKGSSMRWDVLRECAFAWKIKNSVFAVLWQSKELLGSDIPSQVLVRLRPSLIKRLFITFFLGRSVIFSNTLRRRIMDYFLSYILFELLEAESLRDLVLIARRVLFPPQRALEMTMYAPKSGIITSRLQYWSCILTRLCKGSCKIARLL